MLDQKIKKSKSHSSANNESEPKGSVMKLSAVVKKKTKKRKDSNSSHPIKRKKAESKRESDEEEQAEQTVIERSEDNDTSQGSTPPAKKPSKRQLKKEKAEQRESIIKDKSRSEATERALDYVLKWENNRSNWKFEKLRQIWLMEHLLEENSIPDTVFPTVLKYFEGCKGMAREQLIKKGMNVMKKAENEENQDEVTETVAYKRARQLIQVLPVNT